MHDPFKPVEITMRDGRTHVVVDGHDITNGLQGYTLRQDGPQRAELELDVTVLTASVMHERTEVIAYLPDEARRALMIAGWTPPSDPGDDTATTDDHQ